MLSLLIWMNIPCVDFKHFDKSSASSQSSLLVQNVRCFPCSGQKHPYKRYKLFINTVTVGLTRNSGDIRRPPRKWKYFNKQCVIRLCAWNLLIMIQANWCAIIYLRRWNKTQRFKNSNSNPITPRTALGEKVESTFKCISMWTHVDRRPSKFHTLAWWACN